jgi:amino acid adenylation domain-containing protein/non-ribosomal peptide synthase protein (TIGR01720 family)
MEELAARYCSRLEEIVRHCRGKERPEPTPSDFYYRRLSVEKVEELRQRVRKIDKGAEIENLYPLAPMQTGIFFHYLMDPSTDAYFEQNIISLEGQIELKSLKRSFQLLAARHDIFRTLFFQDEEGKQPFQTVLNRGKLPVRTKDLTRGKNAEVPEKALQREKEKERRKKFDLSAEFPMRVSIFKTGADTYCLIWSFHHIIMDGWCMGILFKELLDVYGRLTNGEPVQPEPAPSYGSYLEWLGRQDKAPALNYWRTYLSGYEQQAGLPGVIKGAVEDNSGAYKTGTHSFVIDEDLLNALNNAAAEKRVTLHTIFQTAWGILLQRFNNTEDVVFGNVVSGRPPDLENVEQIVGLFIDTLPVRIRLKGEQSFPRLALRVQEESLLSQSFQHVPLVEVQALTPLSRGLIDHIMIYENYPLHEELSRMGDQQDCGFSITDVEVFEQTNYDFNIALVPGRPFTVTFAFNALVYDEAFIRRLGGYLLTIIRQVASNRDIQLKDIEIVPEEEKRQLLFDFNDTAEDYPVNKTIHRLFAEQAARTPDHTALVGENPKLITRVEGTRGLAPLPVQVTYKELDNKSHQLAAALQEKGVTPDTIVGIMVERSVEMITGLLGILKAGGAYLPIDPGYPKERIEYMLSDSGAKVLLTDDDLRENLSVSSVSSVAKNNLAYVIYTSGTTGKPKGVLVEHTGVVNVVTWFGKTHGPGPGIHMLHLSEYTFDASIDQIFGTLLHGGVLHVIPGDLLPDLEVLRRYIAVHRVNIINFVPMMLKELLVDKPKIKSLHTVISGADRLDDIVKEKLLTKGYRLYNQYGPTEATVDTLACRCLPGEKVHLGQPIANVKVYILDGRGNLLPVAVPGELFISGAGITRGYLNRPELTAEKFILPQRTQGTQGLSYLSYMSNRSYRTGDLARWLTDGNIEFIGRIDHQVKIRGYRIELEEIENRLLALEGIREAVVIDRQDRSGHKYLCGYIVPGSSPGKGTIEIKNILSKMLPDYMVPTHLVEMEKIPLTPTGKIDRKRLPEPEVKAGEGRVPPRDEIEKTLAVVWGEVLNIEYTAVGIDDNFFDLGGDSIKAIQISTRMNQEGYKVDIKDIFQNPTISTLTPYVTSIERISDQSAISGRLPLTPIQQWFFQQPNPEPHHFNQAVMLFTEQRFEKAAVETIFLKLQEHHDALRMTYKRKNGEIIQENHGLDHPLSLQVFDYRNRKGAISALESTANEVQVSIDLETGPLMKLALFHLDDGDRLLIVIHHLVIDVVSWRILLEDIETLYQQYNKKQKLKLPYKTDSFKLWAEELVRYSNSDLFRQEKSYWAELEAQAISMQPIKRDIKEGSNFLKDTETLTFLLSKEESELLLTKTNQAFAAEINDILLTALGLAIKKTFGNKKIAIALEGHGREKILSHVNIERTVAWFTSLYPVLLDLSYENSGENLSRQIKEIKEILHRVPNRGIGYGIFKYLTSREHKKDITFNLNPQISFNYLGQTDADTKQMTFAIAAESVGSMMSVEQKREADFDVTGMMANQQLRISIVFSTKQYEQETVETLRDHYKTEIRRIISYCVKQREGQLTPVDFTYKQLSIETVDQLSGQYDYNIQDIYPLSPMQEGLLFYALYKKNSSMGFLQTSYRLQGTLDISLVEKSLNELFKRHDMLRTAIIFKQVERPLQLVLKDRTVDFSYKDLRGMTSPEEIEKFIKEFKEKDRLRSFDLSKDVLMRVKVMRLEDSTYEFTWGVHHIVLDGWCIGILISEFFKIYNGLLVNGFYQLPPPVSYRAYIQWLEKKDKNKSADFWKEYLAGYEEPAHIPQKKVVNTLEQEIAVLSIFIDKTKTNRLQELAKKARVTLNVVMQSIWAIILAKYNDKQDVVFGVVVSGRPSEIEGVESIVGLFINTVPVRIRTDPNAQFSHLLQKVQEDAVASEPYHHYSLAKIQSENPLKHDLFDHLLSFENYPIDEKIDEIIGSNEENERGYTLEVSRADSLDPNNYDFEMLICPRYEQLLITFSYNKNVYDTDNIEKTAAHIEEVVEQILENDAVTCKDIEISYRSAAIPTDIYENESEEFGF